MNTNLKTQLQSALWTFLTAFIIVVLSQIDTVSLDSIKDGSIVGLLTSAVRAGVKALGETFIAWRRNK